MIRYILGRRMCPYILQFTYLIWLRFKADLIAGNFRRISIVSLVAVVSMYPLAYLLFITGKFEEMVRSVAKFMEWKIAICGALHAAGKRHARDSRTELLSINVS